MKKIIMSSLFLVSLSSFAEKEFLKLTSDVLPVLETSVETSISSNYELTPNQVDSVLELQKLQLLEESAIEREVVAEMNNCQKNNKEINIKSETEDDVFEIVLTIQGVSQKNFKSNEQSAFSDKYLSPFAKTIKQKLISNPRYWEQTLKNYSGLMTPEDKVALMSVMGGIFLDDYNSSRVGFPDFTKVSTTDLLIASSDGRSRNGGICRDVIKAQLDMARAMGVEDCYGVVYSSRVIHTNVICKHPSKKGSFLRINYSFNGEVEGQGSEVLTALRGQTNQGLYSQIVNDKGEIVKTVPLEMANIFRSVTSEALDKSTDFGIQKIKLQKGKDTFVAFNGQTTTGTNVTGIAYSKKLSEDTHVAIAGAVQQISNIDDDKNISTIYARVYSDKPILEASLGDTKIEVAVVTDLDFEMTSNFKNHSYFANTAPLSTHLRTDTNIGQDISVKTDSSLKVGIGFQNVSEFKADRVYLDEFRNKITVLKKYDSLDLYGAAEYATSEISNTYVVEAGLRSGSHSVSYRTQGATDDKTPLFLPDAAKKSKVSYTYEYKNTKVFAEYVDDDYFGAGFNAGLEYKFN
jgi:hypothetical protein